MRNDSVEVCQVSFMLLTIFFVFELHFIVDDENEQMVSITETENKYEGHIA